MGPCMTEATWTTEHVEALRSGVSAGLTCSQIADAIGVSRNAVIGKIHGLGLSTGERPGAIAKRMRAAAPRMRGGPTRLARLLRAVAAEMKVDAPPVWSVDTLIETTQRCSLLELAGGRCRWPLSDPGKADFGFCGNDAIAGFSYCAGHARLAYRLPSGRRA